MLPADIMGGVSASRAANLEVSSVMLSTFQKRVNTLLAEFEGSAGSATKVGSQKISRASLSSGSSCFAEADGLFSQYDRVHERLTSLSKTLGLQIEAIGIAVKGARNGFDNLEEELRHRFHEIQAQLKQDQAAAQGEKDGTKYADNTGSGDGYS